MTHFLTGLLVAAGLITSIYAWQAGFVLLALAGILYRWSQGGPLFGESALSPGLRASSMEIIRESENELVLRGSERVIILDRVTRRIRGIDHELARFDEISEIHVNAELDAETQSEFGRYSLALKRRRGGPIRLGYTDDQLDASIIGAKLSTWLAVPVVA
ncbi:hypothetical protein OPU71_15050 [Niveibacterium sp. 24ML]|uniref:hypothetical protein n=1 Tax=Niveibacterium sp. 24ML TaxID=2985512 RepID=UPI00226E4940|nr:hypothetical protein [Niveibacterium sp. 24ML]MCX9157444.1 hypothetical protein [Niveibacterium sp. 24ML]